ncbi:MAG: hypothetical protein WD794_13450 [Mycobacteriales bacterium]
MKKPGFSFGRFGGKAGLLLAGLGLLAIGLGFNGAASQLSILAQVPYVVSGGLLGIALVVLGAAMIVVQGAREDRALLEAKLDLLTDAVLDSRRSAARPGVPTDLSGLVVAGSASYHVPGCRLVDGREEMTYLTPDEARGRDLKACRVCQPDLASTDVRVR